MRVLHINCNYICTPLHQLMVEELSKLGIVNEVFAPTYDKALSVVKPDENVYVSECFKKWDRILFDYKQKKIIKAIEDHYDVSSFDLIHAYTLFTDGNVARILSEKYNVPYVVAVRNTDVNIFFEKMIHLRKRGIETLLHSNCIFFLSKAYQNSVMGQYVPLRCHKTILKKSVIIPNGIDDFWLRNLYNERDYIEIEQRIRKKKIKLVYVGKIDKNKNIILTCKAVELLKKEDWDINLTIVGKIVDKSVFNSVKDYVCYIEARPKEQLIDIYRAADIFVMPSISESFGLVYAEAMSQGLPVVYTKGQGFYEQFPEGEVGYAVNSSDVYGLINAIKKISESYKLISKNAIEKVAKFNWKDICRLYVQTYYKIYKKDA